MSEPSFVEFLSSIKERGKDISFLFTAVQRVVDLKQSYLLSSCSTEEANSALEKLKKITQEFYAQTTKIKEDVQRTRALYSTNGILPENMQLHVVALYSRLKTQTHRFMEAKAELLGAIEKKSRLFGFFPPENSAGAEDVREHSDALPFTRTDDSEKTDADKSMKDLLENLEELGIAYIQLNEIIASSSMEIDSASSKILHTQRLSTGTIAEIETATTHKKRKRAIKLLGVLFMVAIVGVVVVFFGRGILDFFIKLKDALK